MKTGRLAKDGDRGPLSLEGREVSAVDEFQYLGSMIAWTGRMDVDTQPCRQEADTAGLERFWCDEESILSRT